MQNLDGRIRVEDHILEEWNWRDGELHCVPSLCLLHCPVLIGSGVVVCHVRRIEVVVAHRMDKLEFVWAGMHDQGEAVCIDHDFDEITPHIWIARKDQWGQQPEQLLGVFVGTLVEEVAEQRTVAEDEYVLPDTLDHCVLYGTWGTYN